MLDTILDTIFNGLLIGTSSYAIYVLNPLEHPFAYTASAVGLCHGCTGICMSLLDSFGKAESSEGKYLRRANSLITSFMEIVPVPLVNIELYRNSQQTNALALGHGLFIIALAFDLSLKYFDTEGDNSGSTEVLKDLTILGNIASLLFFAVNEDNWPAGLMAFAAFFAYHGSITMEEVLNGTGKNSSLAGTSIFFGLLPLAMEEAVGALAKK